MKSLPGRFTGPAWAGRRVGLLGGSFNPAHEGHRHISRIALQRLGLDEVWWLVSPQNPLKSSRDMVSFRRRFAMARLQARHPRILVTDLEIRLGTRFTFDTLKALGLYYSKTRFVWLMGADNLGQIHRWQHWRGIFNNIPIAVFDRPPYSLRTLASPAASAYARYRVDQVQSRALAACEPPAWIFFPSRLEPLSSTQLRKAARDFGPDSLRSRFTASTFKEANARMTAQTLEKTPISTAPTQPPQVASDIAPPELTPDALKDLIVKSIDDDKGEDIVVVDLRGQSNITDFIVIATGRSARQVGAMADHLVRKLQPDMSFRMQVEGLPQGDWVLIDCGDAVVHLFRPEVRDFYAIEKMWGLEPPALPAAGSAEP
jgi:nicotinate (nicotinamide) nucleotide adenylyltransferase/ribosome silencing factor RsfS/YbeB/iojap